MLLAFPLPPLTSVRLLFPRYYTDLSDEASQYLLGLVSLRKTRSPGANAPLKTGTGGRVLIQGPAAG
jgi:hypothetical protein